MNKETEITFTFSSGVEGLPFTRGARFSALLSLLRLIRETHPAGSDSHGSLRSVSQRMAAKNGQSRSSQSSTLLMIVLFIFFSSSAYALPSFDQVKKNYQKSDVVLLDRHGEVIHELRVDPLGRRLDWTRVSAISPALIRAVIHSEDRRFSNHSGVDWRAAGAAMLNNVFRGSRRGASTITMQVASMLERDLRPKGGKRTVSQKWDQMKAALDLEKAWTKEEILEAYLNLITFRGELQGVQAAARGLFGKEPQGLDEVESLLLAALIRSPNAPAEDVSLRACRAGESIKSSVACADIKVTAQRTLSGLYGIRQRSTLAPHAARMLLSGKKKEVVSTLDRGIQTFATEALNQHLNRVRAQNVTDGAVLVVENKTGNILAYVGSSGNDSPAKYVDGVAARRQAGSTLKPFLYGLALEMRLLTPASILNDSPLDIPTDRGIYRPENYEGDYKGAVSVRTALASSLNVPAVRVIDLTGSGEFIRRLRDLGFSGLESDEHYGASAALGSVDVSLYELVNAYRVLANSGRWSPLTLKPERPPRLQEKGRRILPEETVFLVSDILSDRQARSLTFGLENLLSTRFWTAAKTGTSKDMRDNWCIGYSDRYTVGVWVGNFSGRPMWNVSGITGAAPIWFEVMNHLHRTIGSSPPVRPEGVVEQTVAFHRDAEPMRKEFFLKGTEPPAVVQSESFGKPGIVYPPEGLVIALDPDIPDDNQRVLFEAHAAGPYYRWLINNQYLGQTEEDVLWKPRPGRYVLALVDEKNSVVDSVKFEVRGEGK